MPRSLPATAHSGYRILHAGSQQQRPLPNIQLNGINHRSRLFHFEKAKYVVHSNRLRLCEIYERRQILTLRPWYWVMTMGCCARNVVGWI